MRRVKFTPIHSTWMHMDIELGYRLYCLGRNFANNKVYEMEGLYDEIKDEVRYNCYDLSIVFRVRYDENHG